MKPSLPSIMDPCLQESILQVFTKTQQWTQQFIVEDSGKLVDLASATMQQASTTPENAQNQPPFNIFSLQPIFALHGSISPYALLDRIESSYVLVIALCLNLLMMSTTVSGRRKGRGMV